MEAIKIVKFVCFHLFNIFPNSFILLLITHSWLNLVQVHFIIIQMRDGSSSLVLVVRYGLSLYPHLHCQRAAEPELLLSPGLLLVAGDGVQASWLEELAVLVQVEMPAGAEVSSHVGTLTFSPGTRYEMLVL